MNVDEKESVFIQRYEVSSIEIPAKTLSCYFPNKDVYIGGSLAQRLYFSNRDIIHNDVDVFVFGERDMPSFAIENILKIIFDKVDRKNKEREEECYDSYGRIKGQYDLFTCFKDSMKYDVIFIRKTDEFASIYDSMSSTLAKILLKMNPVGNNQFVVPMCDWNDIHINRLCRINRVMSTQQQILKVEILGLRQAAYLPEIDVLG